MTLSTLRTIARVIRVGMVEMETGETLEGWPSIYKEKAKHYWGESFVTMFQESIKAVAKSKLSGESLRMLMYLMGTIQMNNEWKVLNQREMAEDLELQQSQVSRALKDLAEKQIITKGARMGKGHAYTLNPYFGWKGDFRKHAPAKQRATPLTLLKGGREEISDEIAA